MYKLWNVELRDALNYTKYFVSMYVHLMEPLLYPITSQIFSYFINQVNYLYILCII